MSTIQHIGTAGEVQNFIGTDDYPEQEYLVPQPYKMEMRPQRLISPNIHMYPKASYKNV
jgi:hypothetical protein